MKNLGEAMTQNPKAQPDNSWVCDGTFKVMKETWGAVPVSSQLTLDGKSLELGSARCACLDSEDVQARHHE